MLPASRAAWARSRLRRAFRRRRGVNVLLAARGTSCSASLLALFCRYCIEREIEREYVDVRLAQHAPGAAVVLSAINCLTRASSSPRPPVRIPGTAIVLGRMAVFDSGNPLLISDYSGRAL